MSTVTKRQQALIQELSEDFNLQTPQDIRSWCKDHLENGNYYYSPRYKEIVIVEHDVLKGIMSALEGMPYDK